MSRGRRAAGVKVPRTDAQKAIAKAKRAVNVAKEQERLASLLGALKRYGVGLAYLVRGHPFLGPKKSHPWKFDLADTKLKIAIEIDGGSYGGKPCPACGERPGGRHSRGDREGERMKLNCAVAWGWAVLSFSTKQIDRDVNGCAELIAKTWIDRDTTLRLANRTIAEYAAKVGYDKFGGGRRRQPGAYDPDGGIF